MDGATDSIGAVVVERVYVPPDGHGMPFARHSLVAFPQNTSYGILALTEDNADDRRGLDAYEGADQLNPHPVLAVAHSRMEEWWIPRAWHVAIEPIETGASCPFALDDNTGTDSGRVTCRLATFNVQLNGELVRRLDAVNSLLPETLKQNHRLDVAPQRVKGIRFTIRCPARPIPITGRCGPVAHVRPTVLSSCDGPSATWDTTRRVDCDIASLCWTWRT